MCVCVRAYTLHCAIAAAARIQRNDIEKLSEHIAFMLLYYHHCDFAISDFVPSSISLQMKMEYSHKTRAQLIKKSPNSTTYFPPSTILHCVYSALALALS